MMDFWKAKLAGWIYDPAIMSLAQLRYPSASQEHDNVKLLQDELGIDVNEFSKQAHWMATGADWPIWPEGGRGDSWTNVDLTSNPILIHPLSGSQFDLSSLKGFEREQIKGVAFDRFSSLIEREKNGSIDYRRTHLAFWRFGYEPTLKASESGSLWQVLPADSRIPDRSIWEHLDLVSALAGATHKGQPALLTMSFGPVQGFIAQARSTSDLWAGSHLLSSLIWEGLQLLCEEIGPDAVLYPNLRGVAAVDRWILESVPQDRTGHWLERFKSCGVPWLAKSSDENPLFAATLPNKFVAVVPGANAAELAKRIRERVQKVAIRWAMEAAEKLFDGASGEKSGIRAQVEAQFAGFPEVSWSLADWPVTEQPDQKGLPSETVLAQLRRALGAFYPKSERDDPGIFGQDAWKVLSKDVDLNGVQFYSPNAGLLYPCVYELGDRTLAGAKACRPFEQLRQEGYRCTICGEREWLTSDRASLTVPPGSRKHSSVWGGVVGRNGIKEGEHLCAICTLKRMWPRLFCEQVKDLLGTDEIRRFVVSTHAMAMANPLAKLADALAQGQWEPELRALASYMDLQKDDPTALPKKLAQRAHELRREQGDILRRIPSMLERLTENDSPEGLKAREILSDMLGERVETYYCLLMMDGDKMGAWVSGTESEYTMAYERAYHPLIRNEIESRRVKSSNVSLKNYLESPRVVTPGRHIAISTALNDFSTTVAKYVIEDCFKGRLIYAGGDDVLAMLPVDDLLPAIQLLRAAYSGTSIETGQPDLQLGAGHVRIHDRLLHTDRLLRTMGEKATASIGAVVAHHQSPLSAVLRDLRKAEKAAKNHGRNAFCVRILKRAGGEVGVTGSFGAIGSLQTSSLKALIEFSDWLSEDVVSRRAVYQSVSWLQGLPKAKEALWHEMVSKNLAFQMKRQSKGDKGSKASIIAEHLASVAWLEAKSELKKSSSINPKEGDQFELAVSIVAARILEGMLVTSEFFARGTHRGGDRQ